MSGAVLACLCVALMLSAGDPARAQTPSASAKQDDTALRELDASIQDIKADLLDLEAGLTDLELDLRYPAKTRWTVFVTVAPEAELVLQEVTLSVDGQVVVSHQYDKTQRSALAAGGAQRLHIGNLQTGRHQILISLRGSRDGDAYQREQTFAVDKQPGPRLVELRLTPEAPFAVQQQDRDPAPGFIVFHYDDAE
ncbi:MAG: hypothetical protein L0H19_04350 [Salinisphaera sp.]|nr:hypothetical protein [Salinisphaera sp.]